MIVSVGIQEFDPAVEGLLQLGNQVHGPRAGDRIINGHIAVPQAVELERRERTIAVDGFQIFAAIKALLPENPEGRGQGNAGEAIALGETIGPQSMHGGAEVHIRNGIVVLKGVAAHGSHISGEDHLGDLVFISCPGGCALFIVIHGAVAANGQGTVGIGPGQSIAAGIGFLRCRVHGEQRKDRHQADKHSINIFFHRNLLGFLAVCKNRQ